MKIKICGLNPARDVQLCIDLKVNYLGFVFYEKSPRNVSLPDIKILSNYDKKKSIFVAVTVNPSNDFINKNLIGNFDYIQLHGSETKDRITEIQNMGFKIIKAIKFFSLFSVLVPFFSFFHSTSDVGNCIYHSSINQGKS